MTASGSTEPTPKAHVRSIFRQPETDRRARVEASGISLDDVLLYISIAPPEQQPLIRATDMARKAELDPTRPRV
jgi:hypothetical protein